MNAYQERLYRQEPPMLIGLGDQYCIRSSWLGEEPVVRWTFPTTGALYWFQVTGDRNASIGLWAGFGPQLIATPPLELPMSFGFSMPIILQNIVPLNLEVRGGAHMVVIEWIELVLPVDKRLWPWPGGKRP